MVGTSHCTSWVDAVWVHPGNFTGLDFRSGGARGALPPASNASFAVYSSVVFAQVGGCLVQSTPLGCLV